jgi:hypothetical protein
MNPMSAVHTEHVHPQILARAFQHTEEFRVKTQSVMALIQVKHN